jgi:polyhydroxybutyrate depolymerase
MDAFIRCDNRGRLKRLLFMLPFFLLIMACGGTALTQPAPAPTGQAVSTEPVGGTTPSQPAPAATIQAVPTEPAATIHPEALAAGDTTRSLVYAGSERTYVLHIPSGYDGTHPTALVLAFHGIGLNAEEMIRISGLSEQADASGFIVAYPNGTGATKSWNGGHCCGEAAKNRVDDVGFVRALIDELAGLTNIDPGRVYATGFSNGAIMVYRLACELSDRIAAIAAVSATQIQDDQQACHPARSVPVMHFHGTADRLNPYDGATTSAGFVFVSVEDAIGFWTEKEACPGPVQRTESGNIQQDVYAACAQGSTIELYTIQAGEHAWPGGQAVSPQVGEPTMEISASPLIWEFFAAHPMP